MASTKRMKSLLSHAIVAGVTAAITLIIAVTAFNMLGYHKAHIAGAPVEEAEGTLYTCGMHPWIITEEPGDCPICGMTLTPKRDESIAASTGQPAERQIAYWRAPMNPTEIYDKPGKSAMGMDLVPVYEDELIGGVQITIDPVTQQNMGIRTAEAIKDKLAYTIRTYGHVTSDETRTFRVSPKASGWIEKLYVDFEGKFVAAGAPLYEIYSPELLAVQEEYLIAFRNLNRSTGRDPGGLIDSARRRLEYFDIAPSEIKMLEQTGQVKKTLLVRSPASGFVIDKNIEKGGYVKAGTTLLRIADLYRVWVEAHIYEYELPWVREGQEVEMTLPYLPGKTFSGKVAYVYPYLQPKTRDVVIRLEFQNPDMILKPEMYADVRIKTQTLGEGLIIPSESVIRSGERNIVFITRENNKFTPRDVTLGLSLDNGNVQILTGLAPGDRVVTSGQFLLDSESKLKEAVQKMLEAKTTPPEPAATDDDFFEDMEEPEEEDDFFKDMETSA